MSGNNYPQHNDKECLISHIAGDANAVGIARTESF